MVEQVLSLLGPLAYPECRRSARRSTLIWLRLIPTVLAALTLAMMFVIGRFWAVIDPSHQPADDIRGALGMIVSGVVGLVLIVTPALLAGSLAGEKERGSIGLLLSTEANARDIVLSRWVGRLASLALVAGAIIPFLVGLLSLASYSLAASLTLVTLIFALGLGGGGFALAVSAVSRQGRDALLVIYLLDIIALIASFFASVSGAPSWLILALNPALVLGPLLESQETAPALMVAVGWSVLGVVGLALASWRLRPSCLHDPAQRRGSTRRGSLRRVPPMSERPMLWKELYIDRAGSLGRVGQWLGGLVALWLGLGSIILAILAAAGLSAGEFDSRWAIDTLGTWYGRTATSINLLIQWSIGLRSAVMVASERERGTWDGLLTSPLTPTEIVAGKLSGSWFALRWLVGSALVAWTLTVLNGGMTPYRYALALAETLVWGTLMAAFGLAMSLRMATATRAMAATVIGWCVAFIGCKLAASMGTAFLLGLVGYLFRPTGVGWFVFSFRIGIDWGSLALVTLVTSLVLLDTFARFDRIAGRAAGGVTAAAIENLIHGRPMAPVRLNAASPAPASAGVRS